MALMAAFVVLALARSTGDAHESQQNAKPAKAKSDAPKKDISKTDTGEKPPVKLGLHMNAPKALQGYTLLAPMDSPITYLLDMQGRVVRSWESDCTPALCPLLLENGHLLRPGSIGGDTRVFGPGPGVGGRIQEFTWEGEVVWDFKFYNARQLPHHDMTRLPNGNVLLIVSDRKTNEEILAAGRRPELAGDSHSIPDALVEIKPTGKTTGEVVWEWRLWDHLIQDFDKTKANYGKVAAHPELVNINYGEDELKPPPTPKDGKDKAKGTGKVAAKPVAAPPRGNPDWTHFNGVAYNPDLDQIAVSVHSFSEFWIIDHSTTTAEAKRHKGGRSGKGGDLLYRWGNPRAYGAGTRADQKLFRQHNAHWIPKGLPGAGHILVFNNGPGRPDGTYSSVDELILPVDAKGRYSSKPGAAFGPNQPVWSYTSPTKQDFYSSFISGTQRLVNGNTLICSGANGTIFEVTPEKEIVWKYVNPVKGGRPVGPAPVPGRLMSDITRDLLAVSPQQGQQLDGIQKEVDARLDQLLTADQKKHMAKPPSPGMPSPGIFAAPPRPGRIMTDSEQSRLKLTHQQKQELATLQKSVNERLDKVLNKAQKKQIEKTFPTDGPRPGGPPPGGPRPLGPGDSQAGKILSPVQQDQLKLSPEQKKRLAEIQKEIDGKLAKLLTGEQRKQLEKMQRDAVRATLPGPGRGGPPGGAAVFRAYRYPVTYPAFAGRKLTPGKTVEELQPKEPEKKGPEKKKAAQGKQPNNETPKGRSPDSRILACGIWQRPPLEQKTQAIMLPSVAFRIL
jgi:hypothetical protein